MALYMLTIFLSAFLLFQVQPLIGRFILPWFGGGPAVWTTCMLFFQTALLVGYAYAHLVKTRLSERGQVWAHLAVLAAASTMLLRLPSIAPSAMLLYLPSIAPSDFWKPEGSGAPALHILLILAACVGLPCFALSATSPLLQAWFNVTHPGRSPYKLYALSNVGSLLALASYPFAIEPYLRLWTQSAAWSAGFVVFAALCVGVALRMRKAAPAPATPAAPGVPAAADAPLPGGKVRLLWLALPACGSVMLLAVTNQMCCDVAVVPFLWVLPLSLYLLSFILVFESDRIYWRPIWLPLLAAAVTAIIWLIYQDVYAPIVTQVLGYSAGLFVCCMVCHGELARLKPAPRHLTSFYLTTSAGGALGGILVTIVAPLVLPGYYELHAGLVLCLVLAAVALRYDFAPTGRWRLPASVPLFWFGSAALILATGISLGFHIYKDAETQISSTRNFYGVLKVEEKGVGSPALHRYDLRHGRILHGTQYTGEPLRSTPTKYYWKKAGVGLAILNRQDRGPMKVGVVGLGTGTIAAYARPGDTYRFYEINPEVRDMSGPKGYRFTYLSDGIRRGAACEVVMGDARLSLEREPPQGFDVLALDAFSSDAIPVHLLTQEAVKTYRRHLHVNPDGKPDGVLAVHISNRYLNLRPIVLGLTKHFSMHAATIDADDDDKLENSNCTWVLVSDDQAFLLSPPIYEATDKTDDSVTPLMWTDDYSGLFIILRYDTSDLFSFLKWRSE